MSKIDLVYWVPFCLKNYDRKTEYIILHYLILAHSVALSRRAHVPKPRNALEVAGGILLLPSKYLYCKGRKESLKVCLLFPAASLAVPEAFVLNS